MFQFSDGEFWWNPFLKKSRKRLIEREKIDKQSQPNTLSFIVHWGACLIFTQIVESETSTGRDEKGQFTNHLEFRFSKFNIHLLREFPIVYE